MKKGNNSAAGATLIKAICFVYGIEDTKCDDIIKKLESLSHEDMITIIDKYENHIKSDIDIESVRELYKELCINCDDDQIKKDMEDETVILFTGPAKSKFIWYEGKDGVEVLANIHGHIISRESDEINRLLSIEC